MGEFLNRMGGAALNDLKGTPLDRIVNHLMGGQPGASGLQALVDRLRNGGLREEAESWVGPGENRPVTPAQLELALGQEETRKISEESGVPQGGLMSVLAVLLPRLVDGMTPQGRVPQSDEELPPGGVDGYLGGMLRGDRPDQPEAQGGLLGTLMSGAGAAQETLGKLWQDLTTRRSG